MQKMMVKPAEIILDTSSLSKKRIETILHSLKSQSNGKVKWVGGGELDSFCPLGRIVYLIYKVRGSELSFSYRMRYTLESQHVYKNAPWWIKAIVEARHNA